MNYITKILLFTFPAVLSFLIYTDIAFPINISDVIAYPVPFNPKIHKNLNIAKKPGHDAGIINKVKIEIFDINGDQVLSGNYSNIPVLWNGRNDKGKLVGPGLYIIKVILENSTTGEYKQKIIRILING
jgi:hypothetical protein